jgi:hypothetical protein
MLIVWNKLTRIFCREVDIMKKFIMLLLILSTMIICIGCKGNRVDNDNYNRAKDVFLEEIYPR